MHWVVRGKNWARDLSYITSALVGGGGSENANFCLFLVLKTCWHRRGEGGSKNPQKCDDVIYEWSPNEGVAYVVHIRISAKKDIIIWHDLIWMAVAWYFFLLWYISPRCLHSRMSRQDFFFTFLSNSYCAVLHRFTGCHCYSAKGQSIYVLFYWHNMPATFFSAKTIDHVIKMQLLIIRFLEMILAW